MTQLETVADVWLLQSDVGRGMSTFMRPHVRVRIKTVVPGKESAWRETPGAAPPRLTGGAENAGNSPERRLIDLACLR